MTLSNTTVVLVNVMAQPTGDQQAIRVENAGSHEQGRPESGGYIYGASPTAKRPRIMFPETES